MKQAGMLTDAGNLHAEEQPPHTANQQEKRKREKQEEKESNDSQDQEQGPQGKRQNQRGQDDAMENASERCPIIRTAPVAVRVSPTTTDYQLWEAAEDALNSIQAAGHAAMKIPREGSKITKQYIKKLKFPKEALIAGVVRKNESRIANGDFRIRAKDRVVVLCSPKAIHKVEAFF